MGRPPLDSSGLGMGLRVWRELCALRHDDPGGALCARCGRSTRMAATLERYLCEAAGRSPARAEPAVRLGLCSRVGPAVPPP